MTLPENALKRIENERSIMELFTLAVALLGAASYLVTKSGTWFALIEASDQMWLAWYCLLCSSIGAILIAGMGLKVLVSFLARFVPGKQACFVACIIVALVGAGALTGVISETFHNINIAREDISKFKN